MASTNNQTPAVQIERPWLTANGHALAEEVLRQTAKAWDEETWARYLDSIEGSLSESQIHHRRYQQMLEETEQFCWQNSQSSADEETKNYIDQLMKELSPQQQQILKMIFWAGRSERSIAFDLGLSRSTVRTFKKRALRYLAIKLKGGVAHFAISERSNVVSAA